MANFYGRTGIELSGDLIENLGNLLEAVRPACVEAVAEAAEIIRMKAYEFANVSPGEMGHGLGGAHMRDQIAVEVREYATGVSARIGIDTDIIPYAPHQEFGPHGNAFLRRALDESRDDCHETMRVVFSFAIAGAGKFTTKVRFRKVA